MTDVDDRTLHLASQPVESAAVAADRVLEFEAFFEREKVRLFQALCLVTRNRFEAEELAQDAFLSVYERWDRIAEMDDPTGYLYRTAMNAFRSSYRRSTLAAKRAIGLTRADDAISGIEEQDVVVRAGWVQTDAQINQGNSGGPLVDRDGRVIGVTSLGFASGGSGLGFAVDARKLCPLVTGMSGCG